MKRPSAKEQAWSIYLLRGRLTLVGFVHAKDAAEAVKRAVTELEIRQADRFRLCARPGY
jgi:hypothetical protein